MEEVIKIQIAIGIFIGVIILTFFNLLRTIVEKFIVRDIERVSPKSQQGAGCFFLIMFIIIFILIGIILLIILLNPTDLHPIGNIIRKILRIEY